MENGTSDSSGVWQKWKAATADGGVGREEARKALSVDGSSQNGISQSAP